MSTLFQVILNCGALDVAFIDQLIYDFNVDFAELEDDVKNAMQNGCLNANFIISLIFEYSIFSLKLEFGLDSYAEYEKISYN